jgi:hypothetical protein
MEKYRFYRLAPLALACVLGSLACSTSAGAIDDAPGGPGSGNPDAAGPGSGNPDAATPIGAAGSKRGIAYGFRTAADLAALGPTVSWWYNWADKPDIAAPGPAFLPMIWGKTFDIATLDAHIPAGTEYLLTFNEPNFGDQSNVTPEQAAALWPQIQAFAKRRGMKLVSPAVNYCGSPCNETDPFVWLQKFLDACKDCQVDYIAMHWYACDKPAIVNTLAKYEAKFAKPLWVTELACLDVKSKVNEAAELAYMKDAVAALEADPMVFRYAWFTGRSTNSPAINLFGADGKLTALGAAYVAQPSH